MLWPELLNLVYGRKLCGRQRELGNSGDSEKSCELYLVDVLTNPLTLKQLARIVIRDRIINNMKNFQFVNNFVITSEFYQAQPSGADSAVAAISKSNSRNYFSLKHTSSIFECLIWQLTDLPKILHYYLYAFPDIEPVTNDLTNVFINE